MYQCIYFINSMLVRYMYAVSTTEANTETIPLEGQANHIAKFKYICHGLVLYKNTANFYSSALFTFSLTNTKIKSDG